MTEQRRPSWSMPVGSGDRWASDYERARPGWPAGDLEIVDPSAPTVLDLGAGTAS